jgi:hypothetical protein
MRTALLLGAVLLGTSCATVKKAETAKNLEIYGPGVIQNPVIADLDVQQQKVRGTATGRTSATETLKNLALANAIRTANADLLVAPVYELETSRGRTSVTVSGFPATYTNFRSATPADSSLIDAGYMHRANTAVANDVKARKGSAGWIVATVITVAAVLVGILAL